MFRLSYLKGCSTRLLALSLLVLLAAMNFPAVALAAPDAALQKSLNSFFSHGIIVRGAAAELIDVVRWPETRGSVRWSLPVSLHGYPKRFSLIAEQNGRRWYVPVQVHWWVTAIVMNKSVSARTLLTQRMLIMKRTDIAGLSGQWSEHASELTGMRLNRHLNKGDVVLSNLVKRPPLIKRGDLVSIILDMGNLHVRSDGKALRNAGRGERILVKNLHSNEVLQAIAEDSGVVRVTLRRIPG